MPYEINNQCRGCGHCYTWCPTKAITGRRKAAYRILAERCIDCGACGRICTFEAVRMPDASVAIRMKISEWPRPIWDLTKCDQCGKCISACPAQCVTPSGKDEPDKGWRAGFPCVSRPKLCISCGFCAEVCETGAVRLAATVRPLP